ncbi:DUF4254 domain-containing protein [Nocardia transvalensis]|nr:DUF4254 domain-containing protein [Nocardia transvalensis]
MLRAAHALTELHEQRLGCDPVRKAEIDELRARLIRRIDRWIHENLPPAPGSARIHTETMGAIVDRLSLLTASAYAALASADDCELGEVWEGLAELAVGYEDLVEEVASGRRRLPGGP